MDQQRRQVDGPASAGFTLVEMMVSMTVLSIVLAAVAASLIGFTRASVDNERRIQSTAFLNSLHEDLQAVPWSDALLYEGETGPLADVGVAGSPPTFEGQPLATRPGPGCVGPSCRIESIPEAYEVGVVSEQDGRVYTVYRIITDVSRGNDPTARDVKRFTTIVRWESLGQTVEQRFDSERAPTPDEYTLANTPEVTQFLISPSEVQLDEHGHPYTAMSVSARFRDDVTGAVLHFPNGIDTLTLTRQGTSNRFAGTIPTDHVFAHGERAFEVRGAYTSGYASATTTVTLLEWTEGVQAPPPAPVVTSVVPTPLTVTAARMPSYGKGSRLCTALTIRVRVDGLVPPAAGLPSDVSVTAYYEGQRSPEGAGLVSNGGIDGSADEFVLEFPKGTSSPWSPGRNVTMYDAFTVVARNGEGPQSLVVTSQSVQINGPTSASEQC
jgi:prepilin-type N-terminal cleavage/methylation domain-containing protein